jgi:hypothetical protein
MNSNEVANGEVSPYYQGILGEFPIHPLPILIEEFNRENGFRIDFSSYSILPLEWEHSGIIMELFFDSHSILTLELLFDINSICWHKKI